jgi:hypothetical protein
MATVRSITNPPFFCIHGLVSLLLEIEIVIYLVMNPNFMFISIPPSALQHYPIKLTIYTYFLELWMMRHILVHFDHSCCVWSPKDLLGQAHLSSGQLRLGMPSNMARWALVVVLSKVHTIEQLKGIRKKSTFRPMATPRPITRIFLHSWAISLLLEIQIVIFFSNKSWISRFILIPRNVLQHGQWKLTIYTLISLSYEWRILVRTYLYIGCTWLPKKLLIQAYLSFGQ